MFYLKMYNKTLLNFGIEEDNLDGQKVVCLREAKDFDNKLIRICRVRKGKQIKTEYMFDMIS